VELSWKVGHARVTRIPETCTPVPAAGLLPDATPQALAPHLEWLAPHFIDADGNFPLSVHGLLVESCGKRILVDTCIGEHSVPEFGVGGDSPFLANLEAAGFDRRAIDVVLCTHLHFDHVGWNTMRVGGRWLPTFPNARYLFARVEWEHWSAQQELGYAATLNQTVRPIVEAGLAELVETDFAITGEVRLEPTPGHTPGHVAVRIESEGEAALITGDLTHHPVQWAEPDWGMDADTDRRRAAQTRRELLARHADTGLLVIGTHYPPPTAGRLVTVAGRRRFVAR